jgi:hypothetical protein
MALVAFVLNDSPPGRDFPGDRAVLGGERDLAGGPGVTTTQALILEVARLFDQLIILLVRIHHRSAASVSTTHLTSPWGKS